NPERSGRWKSAALVTGPLGRARSFTGWAARAPARLPEATGRASAPRAGSAERPAPPGRPPLPALDRPDEDLICDLEDGFPPCVELGVGGGVSRHRGDVVVRGLGHRGLAPDLAVLHQVLEHHRYRDGHPVLLGADLLR